MIYLQEVKLTISVLNITEINDFLVATQVIKNGAESGLMIQLQCFFLFEKRK